VQLAKDWLDNNKSIAVIGSSHSGKTSLAIWIATQCSHKDKYTLGYPQPLKSFTPLSDKDDLYRLHDCVIVIDEFQRYFDRYGRHHNDALDEAIDFAEHRNIKLILTAQNNQAIDRNLESRIKCWALKRINIHTLKQGGMCKVATTTIKDPRITSSFLALELNEVLWWNIDSYIGENGIRTFPDPMIGKAWKNVETNVHKRVRKDVQPNVQ